MRYEIRAMSFAEILDTGFRLLRDHFVVLVGIGLVLYAPLALISEWMTNLSRSGRLDPALVSLLLAAVVLTTISPIATGAMTLAIGELYRGGRMGLSEAYGGSLRRVVALVGTYLLLSLAVVVGLILLLLPGFYLMVAWMLVTQIVMLEGVAGPSALGRSWRLLRGHMMRALGVFLVGVLIMFVLSTSLQLLLSKVAIVGSLANALAQSVGLAFYTAVGVVLYFDLRCRKENFDLEHLAQVVESAGAPEGALGQEP